jgi:hypothetical protein
MNELERARDQLKGDWKRADLERVLHIKKSKAAEKIRFWLDENIAEPVPGLPYVYRWTDAAAESENPGEYDSQPARQSRADVRAPRPSGVPMLVKASAGLSAASAIALMVLAYIMATSAPQSQARQPLIEPTAIPTQLPTATATALATIPAWWAPGGDPAPGVDPATIRDYTGRYGDYVQVNGDLWIPVQHAAGVNLPSLPDLRPPEPTPTARIVIEQVPVYVEVPAPTHPPAPAQRAQSTPPEAHNGGGGGLAPAPAILSEGVSPGAPAGEGSTNGVAPAPGILGKPGTPEGAPQINPAEYWVSGYEEWEAAVNAP